MEDKDEQEHTLDGILKQIGEFGPYQLFNYILLCLPMAFNAFQSISYVFTANSATYRCNVPQCDTLTSEYLELWTNFTIPYTMKNDLQQMDSCHRFSFTENLINRSAMNELKICTPDKFNKSELVTCFDGYKFRKGEYTIANQFKLVCEEEWKLNMVGTINNVGQFIGVPFGGFLADRYGRRNMLAICGFTSSIIGILRSFSINYYMFVALEMLDMIAGSTLYPTAFLLAIELVGPKCRVIAATIVTLFYPIGETLLAILARSYENWRILLRVLYTPGLIHILLLFLLPESVRWLLNQKRDKEAVKILKKAANINRRQLNDTALQELLNTKNFKLDEAKEGKYPIKLAIKTFLYRLMNCSFCWFTHTLVALGLSLTSVKLDGDKYMNFMWNSLIQIPGLLIPLLIRNSIGRRMSLFISLITCGLCMLATIFLAKYGRTVELILFLIGKLAITCSFQILYFFTFELFPTNVRHSLLSLCSMIGRVGSMIAPQIPLLMQHYEYAPQLIFCIFALSSGCLTLLFPETANKILPTTIVEAVGQNLVVRNTETALETLRENMGVSEGQPPNSLNHFT